MITINELKLYRIHFDSVLDAVHYLETTPYNWSDRAPLRTDSYYAKESWSLGDSAEDILRHARNGWAKGVKDVEMHVSALANNRTNSWKADVHGEQLDIKRYLEGRPDCMRRRGNVHGRKPIVSIFVNNWINSAVSADQMVKFGAAMVAAIDAIENSGKRVELIVGTVAPSHSSVDKRVMSATWTAKRAEDPLDLSAIAFSLAHPGASRRFGWRIWAHSKRSTDRAFGVAINWKVTPDMLIDPPADLMIIPGMNGNWNRCKTMEDARLMVATQINEAAGEELVEL